MVAIQTLVPDGHWFCYTLKITNHMSNLFEIAVFGFKPHTPITARWAIPESDAR